MVFLLPTKAISYICPKNNMLHLHIKDETSRLKAVVLGTAKECGPTPLPEAAYDPKSLEHILAGTYPKEAAMVPEMETFAKILKKYGVQVFRPKVLPDCNQIFSRDIAFVIEDKLIKANILPDREEEFEAMCSTKSILKTFYTLQIRFILKGGMLCLGTTISS